MRRAVAEVKPAYHAGHRSDRLGVAARQLGSRPPALGEVSKPRSLVAVHQIPVSAGLESAVRLPEVWRGRCHPGADGSPALWRSRATRSPDELGQPASPMDLRTATIEPSDQRLAGCWYPGAKSLAARIASAGPSSAVGRVSALGLLARLAWAGCSPPQWPTPAGSPDARDSG